jgi:hypothetical protein
VNTRYNNTEYLVESFGQVVEDVARSYNLTVWTSAHHEAKQNARFYHDQVHPGLFMLRLVRDIPLHSLTVSSAGLFKIEKVKTGVKFLK